MCCIMPAGNKAPITAFNRLGDKAMTSNFRVFFAGVGTTFIILGAGFGGGLMMAKSALEEPTGYRSGAPSEPLPPARVVLPSTTEAALPPQTLKEQQIAAPSPEPAPQPQAQPAKEVVEAPGEQLDTKKAKAEERTQRKRLAERKAKRLAKERAKHQHIEPERPRGPVMAFGGDEPPQRSGGFGFFGRE
jgi:type IV secretory pathway VirB10-like protein